MNKSLGEVHGTVKTNKTGWRKILAFLGPAYLVSVGYMDPGNWATDIAGGSAFGYRLIWVLLMSNLIAVLLQSLSARLGIVRGVDLAQASKQAYPKWANIPLYILAEIAIAACDLAEIVGMAIGLNLLFGLPLIWGISITAFDTVILLFLLKKGMRTMELFIISLVSIIGLSFLVEMFIVSPDYGEVVKGFIPSALNSNALYISIGIIGATVMPHNLYLHSSLVQTRQINKDPISMRNAIKLNLFDTTIALNLAFFVNAAILVLAAAAFYVNGYYQVAEIQDASQLLENLFGTAAPTFFAIALVAAGQSSTITGTLAGQIIMEGHLNLRIKPWLRRLITRLLAIIPAVLTIIYFGDDALGDLLVLSQVILSLQLGFAIIPLIHFTSDKKQMKGFAIHLWVKILAWISAFVIIYLNIKLVIDEIKNWILHAGDAKIYIYSFVIPLAIAALLLLIYVFIHPLLKQTKTRKMVIPHRAKDSTAYCITPFKKIAIAVDFENDSRPLISYALQLGTTQSKYLLIHIVESAGAHYHGENADDLETTCDKQHLMQIKKEIEKLGYQVDLRIGYGTAAEKLVNIIQQEQCDLVILGSHGHKGIKDYVYGTTSEYIKHRIKVPLFIVK